ncbi:cytochrome c oxidase assembly factor Coa1 family protein [Cohnella panacarvi]|uniref:cytochrome c oxidase assembly factor Coa1 family protein n=1 Tax=Cohnella panacarvi TaxID=400776 RepID=UPI00047ED7D4|nr:cytochrome c oxidase assembly factor Coa1 family protein [Cohnella panacarvi]
MTITIYVINTIIVVFSIAVVLGAIQLFKKDRAYTTALNYIKSNAEIRSIVGSRMRFSYLPRADIEIDNGYGKAEITIKVKGDKKRLVVRFELHKQPNSDWVIDQVTYK